RHSLHGPVLRIRSPTATMAPTCRWRSRPQHHFRTSSDKEAAAEKGIRRGAVGVEYRAEDSAMAARRQSRIERRRRVSLSARMGRREFAALICAAAAGLPIGLSAQEPARVRRIGVLMNLAEDDPQGKGRLAALQQGLRELGWIEGRSVRIDTRWAAANPDRFRTHATELVGLTPDLILAATTPGVTAIQQASREVPIIFVNVIDPVSAGFVSNLARPGGNVTGFSLYEYGTSSLLKNPSPSRVCRDSVFLSRI